MNSFKFRTTFAEDIFHQKYAQGPNDTWPNLAIRLVEDVCGTRWGSESHALLSKSEQDQLARYIIDMKFIPGGRYLYYAGRPLHFYNNCFCLKGEEDTREEWGSLLKRASDCLMSGGGIGVDYSVFRENGRVLKRTGGISSGPIPLMRSINEVGRNVMQGGSRRSAIFASLNWKHGDINEFLHAKDYTPEQIALKEKDFNFPLPLDMTNISINWDTEFINSTLYPDKPAQLVPHVSAGKYLPQLWYDSVKRMCKTGEPGHAYNFWENEKDTLRNACTEFTSEDDSDVCNLGSINLANINSIEELRDVISLASKFLVCGTIRGDVPYEKVKTVREKNRKIGLGLMGIHEWLLQRGYAYEVPSELKQWLEVYKEYSEKAANELCDRFGISRPKKYRAIAPAGTIGILASTTTGIEPLFAVAYKRRYLEGGTRWRSRFIVDATAERIINDTGVDPDNIETAYHLATNPERRLQFQAELQDYVDMGISSTLNLPAWNTKYNNQDTAKSFAETLAKYCHRLRGITAYPDGARGGQPLTVVPYKDAISKRDVIFDEIEEKCSGGVCGI